jgi:hypothetical protein
LMMISLKARCLLSLFPYVLRYVAHGGPLFDKCVHVLIRADLVQSDQPIRIPATHRYRNIYFLTETDT